MCSVTFCGAIVLKGLLRFLLLSHLLYVLCVKISNMNRYVSKRGAALVSAITSYYFPYRILPPFAYLEGRMRFIDPPIDLMKGHKRRP